MENSDILLLENRPQRDLRIDFFRGLALMMILIDHLESNLELSLLSRFTLKSFGYCDAAEIFVFLSGYLYGCVYSRMHHKHGSMACIKKSMRRGFSLYLTTLITLCCCLAISVPFAFHNTQIARHLYLSPLLELSAESVLYLIDLLYTPYGFEILRLYIVLFLILIPTLFALLKSNASLAWLLSINMYLLSQTFSWFTLPMVFREFRSFHFNPFSWQLLFFIGIVIGSRTYDGKPVLFQNCYLKYIALIILVFAFYVNVSEPTQIASGSLNQFTWMNMFQSIDLKQTLGPLRLINFLALAYFVGKITESKGTFWKSKLAYPLVACGKRPLIVYCLGLVLMYLNTVLYYELILGNDWIIPLHIIGCGVSISVAIAVDQYYKSRA